MKHDGLRREIIAACLEMNGRGINQGTSGNISARVPEGLLITPSGIPYAEMEPSDIVLMHIDGSHEGTRKPSSEWRFHRDIMANRAEVGAIVHAHSMFATTLACLRMDIPAVHYMIAAAGGPTIRCAPYVTYGTQALSDLAIEALEGRNACLLANHGMIVCETTMQRALGLAVEVEALSRQYCIARQTGTPVLLTEAEMDEALARYADYGKQPGGKR